MSLENSALNLVEEEFVDELKPGHELMFGQYTIEGFLAAGGFGITYLAKDSLGRRIVIKECFPGNLCRRQNASVLPRSRAHQNEVKSIVRLFSQEAMSLAKANHPNIVGVHQVFEENNTAYMALDYVEGRDLLEILEDDPDSLKPDVVTRYLVKVLGAIGHIHSMGILHRDISPDNIIISKTGEPILIDFGAARESKDERATRMLSALRVVKDGYSPQEFYIAGSDQPPSCDLYSLAASFYHVITKELPPDSQWRLSASAAGDPDPYVSVGMKSKGYTENFTGALDKAMSILPRDRMQRAEDWLEYLEKGDTSPVTVKPKRVAAKSAASSQKKSFLPILLGTTALAAAGLGFLYVSAPGDKVSEEVASAAPDATVTAPVVEAVEPVEETVAEIDIVQPDVVAFEQPDFAAPEVGSRAAVPSGTLARLDRVAPKSRPQSLLAGTGVQDTAPAVEQAALQPPKKIIPAPAETAPAEESLAAGMTEPETNTSIAPSVNSAEFFMAMTGSRKVQPNALAAQKQRLARREQTAPAAPASDERISPVISRSVPQVPFALSERQPGVIVAVAVDAPDWLSDNMRIVSVNGTDVSSNEAILAEIDKLAEEASGDTFSVRLSIASSLNGAVFERDLSIARQNQILLLNGLRFVAREGEEGWTTEVLEAPASSNFEPGDTLVSYVSTWENLDGPASLETILNRELASGNSRFNFAVKRDGEIWIETFNLASIAN